MGRSSAKGTLHSETSLPCKQEKMMFPAHRLGSMNTPLHMLILTHRQKDEQIYYWTHWLTKTLRSIKVVQTKAQTYCSTNTWVRWPRVQRGNQWSIHPEMIDLLIWHRWACFMFKMPPVQSWHYRGWATRFEALIMLSKPCCLFFFFYGNSKCTLPLDQKP